MHSIIWESRLLALVVVLGWSVFLGCGSKTGDAGNGSTDGSSDDMPGNTDPDDTASSGDDTSSHGGGGTDATCGEVQLITTRQTVDVLVVLDRSDSMQGTLWRSMKEALTEITLVMADRIHFGLVMFPSLDCDGGDDVESKCILPTNEEVPYVAIGDPQAAEKIAAVFALASQGGVGTCGNTPTAGTLDLVRAYMKSLGSSDRSRTVLLATDGAPNCNLALDGDSCLCTWLDSKCTSGLVEYCLDHDRTVAAAEKVYEAGYPVYVLGVGNSVDWANTMNAIALAGGTQEYHPVTDPEKLLSEMAAITGSVTSCDFVIDWSSLPDNASTDKSKVNFYCKDRADALRSADNLIGYDEACAAEKGWKWDGGKVVFCQDACARLKAGDCAVVEATFGCDSGPVI